MPERKRVLIVGGVAGGASAAARARRLSEDAEIVLFERGEHISFANCGMPYHIGGAITDRDRLLVQTPERMWKRFRIDVRTRHEVLRIDREAKTLLVRNLQTGDEVTERYDDLVLSPGAAPVRPPIEGADSPHVYTLRSLADMDTIKSAVDALAAEAAHAPPRAVVIGGGYIGLEMAEALRERTLDVTLAELADQVFVAADPEMVAPIHQTLQFHGVDLRLGTSVTAIRPQGEALRVVFSDGESTDARLVVLAVGVRPESTLARDADLAIGQRGGIIVDDHMRTSDPHIYAVGDAVEGPHFVSGVSASIPLAGPANRQGRIAADNIFGTPSVYKRTQGTAICKVFDLAIGMTGLGEKDLRRLNRPYEKVYVHPASHAGYYPGAAQISLKVLFDPQNGMVLGAQAVGAAGIDKRIDVLATAIRAGMTVRDLAELELSYAPPYGSAKDPINYAGFVATNLLDGTAAICHVEHVLDPSSDQLILDVRMPEEVEAGTIPGAKTIPLDELRQRLGELPRNKEILVFCQVGLRGYLACRTLTQNGFRCRNLTGGYKTYKAHAGFSPKDRPPTGGLRDDTGETGPTALPDRTCAGDARCGSSDGNPQSTGSASQPSPDPGSAPASASAMPPDGVGGVASCGESASVAVLHHPSDAVRGRSSTACDAHPQTKAGPAMTSDTESTVRIVTEIDARGLQCPGPIMQLKRALEPLGDGEAVVILAADPAFPADVAAWCHSTGNRLAEVAPVNGHVRAVIQKRPHTAPAPAAGREDAKRRKSIVVFSGDFDKAMAAFIIANGAAAMGSEVTLFFTFWGLNILRRGERVKVRKNVIERMFGWMMPRGASRLPMSKMHMGGMGPAMIKGIMRRKNVPSLGELIASAREAGVKLVACSMSMDLMGLRREELIEGVEEGGVAMYLDTAEAGNVNLFI